MIKPKEYKTVNIFLLNKDEYDNLEDCFQDFVNANNIQDFVLCGIDEDDNKETVLIDLDGIPYTFSIDHDTKDIRCLVEFSDEGNEGNKIYLDALELSKVANKLNLNISSFIKKNMDFEIASSWERFIVSWYNYESLYKHFYC